MYRKTLIDKLLNGICVKQTNSIHTTAYEKATKRSIAHEPDYAKRLLSEALIHVVVVHFLPLNIAIVYVHTWYAA